MMHGTTNVKLPFIMLRVERNGF